MGPDLYLILPLKRQLPCFVAHRYIYKPPAGRMNTESILIMLIPKNYRYIR